MPEARPGQSGPGGTVIRILLADDHALVRAALRAILEQMSDVEVVAEVSNGREALRFIADLKPDLVLLDISMPELNGIEVVAEAGRQRRRTRAIIVSMHIDEHYVLRALAAGAAGYLVKNSDRRELEMAVRAVARGETWLTPAVAKLVAAAYARGKEGEADGPFELLTPRQREVLQLIAEGFSTKEIAQRLRLSGKTVETHRTQLMKRLGIRGIAGLVRYAMRVGIISRS